MNYLRQSGRRVPSRVSEALPGQVPNSTGGHAWQIPPLARLRRFLILGAEGGTYYIKQRKLVTENITALAEADPFEALELIEEVSHGGLAPKNDAALFALAYYAGYGHPSPSDTDILVRQAALAKLPTVARTGTHLYHFLAYVENQRGWGRSLRRAVGQWLANRPAEALAYQLVKYRQRDGWTAVDALRLSHPGNTVSSGNPHVEVTPHVAELFGWITDYMHPKNPRRKKKATEGLPDVARGFVRAQKATDSTKVATLIRKYGLPWEAVPDEHLGDAKVWEALLYGDEDQHGMPVGAMLRNLPRMTRVGLLRPLGDATDHVCKVLTDESILKKARIHPLQLLVAKLTYGSGESLRGDSTWQPVGALVDALDEAFYKAFANVEPTGKRHMIALDVSASMDWGPHDYDNRSWVNDVPGLTPRIASAAMMLVTANQGDPYMVTAFSSGLQTLTISPRQRIADVVGYVNRLPAGYTDCSLPMVHATHHEIPVDGFLVFTDNETNSGIHPAQALEQYRQKMGIDAKLVVVGMVSNDFSIADPNDRGMMDVVGFNTSAPQIISEFISGTF